MEELQPNAFLAVLRDGSSQYRYSPCSRLATYKLSGMCVSCSVANTFTASPALLDARQRLRRMPNPKAYPTAMYAAPTHSPSKDIDATIPFKCPRACKLELLRSVTFFLLLLVYVQIYLILVRRRRLARSNPRLETSFLNQDPRSPTTTETGVEDGLATKID